MATFAFDTTIPAASHNPSVDQQPMQINNLSTNDLIAVDHATFNVANGGMHKQVTFESSNIPVIPTTPPVLFVQPPGVGQPNQLYYYSGTAAQGSTQYQISTSNMSTFLLGGMILKTGQITAIANSPTFAYTTLTTGTLAAFPNASFSVVLTPINVRAQQSSPRISAISPTGFTATDTTGVSVGDPATYYFIAIGW